MSGVITAGGPCGADNGVGNSFPRPLHHTAISRDPARKHQTSRQSRHPGHQGQQPDSASPPTILHCHCLVQFCDFLAVHCMCDGIAGCLGRSRPAGVPGRWITCFCLFLTNLQIYVDFQVDDWRLAGGPPRAWEPELHISSLTCCPPALPVM